MRSVSRGSEEPVGVVAGEKYDFGIVVVGEGWMDTGYVSKSDIRFGFMMFMSSLLMVTRVTVSWGLELERAVLVGAGGVNAAISRVLKVAMRCFVEHRMVFCTERVDAGLGMGN